MTPRVKTMLEALVSGALHVFEGIDFVACRVEGERMLFCLER